MSAVCCKKSHWIECVWFSVLLLAKMKGSMNKHDKILCSLKCNENVWTLTGYIFNFHITLGKCTSHWILSSAVEITLIYTLKKLLK